ncbi:MAG: hypothetical protein ABI480_09485 [Chitinophagaceae bacterium]
MIETHGDIISAKVTGKNCPIVAFNRIYTAESLFEQIFLKKFFSPSLTIFMKYLLINYMHDVVVVIIQCINNNKNHSYETFAAQGLQKIDKK